MSKPPLIPVDVARESMRQAQRHRHPVAVVYWTWNSGRTGFTVELRRRWYAVAKRTGIARVVGVCYPCL